MKITPEQRADFESTYLQSVATMVEASKRNLYALLVVMDEHDFTGTIKDYPQFAREAFLINATDFCKVNSVMEALNTEAKDIINGKQ